MENTAKNLHEDPEVTIGFIDNKVNDKLTKSQFS